MRVHLLPLPLSPSLSLWTTLLYFAMSSAFVLRYSPLPSLSSLFSLSSFSYPSSTMSPPLPLASFFLYPDYGRAHGFFSASTLRFLVSRTLYLVQSHPQSLSFPVTRGGEVAGGEDRGGKIERGRGMERDRRIEIKATSQTRRLRSSPPSPSSSSSFLPLLLLFPPSPSLSFVRVRGILRWNS